MVREKPYHHGDLKRALVDEAVVLLERDGPEQLSLRAVARAAGVSQAAPYNHFRDKQELLAALAVDGFGRLAASQAAVGAGPTERRLVDLGLDYVRTARRRPQLYRLMFGVGIVDRAAHPGLEEAKQAAIVPLKDTLTAHLGADDVAATAVTLWAFVHGLASLLLDGSLDGARHDDEALVRHGVGLLLAGVDRGAHRSDGQSAAVIPPSTKTSAPLR